MASTVMVSKGLLFRRLFLALGVFALGVAALSAQAANVLELNFGLSGPRYDADLPPCEAALERISWQFSGKEAKFWNSGLAIVGYQDVREVAQRPRPANVIPRRYCAAKAMMNDGHIRAVHYAIVEDGGFAGMSAGVEWCVVGLDRNWAYNPRCRAAKP